MARPTELAITLAALPSRYAERGGWMVADQVAFRLRLLGFECSAQQVAAWLRRMARADAPWVELREDRWGGPASYRVTTYGRNDIDNRLDGVRPVTPWIPVMRALSERSGE